MDYATGTAANEIELLEHRQVDWSRVRKSRYWMYQRFQYRYPGHIRELYQRLIVVPNDQYGNQRLSSYDLHVSLPTAVISGLTDRFGNRMFSIYIPHVEQEVAFELRLVVERDFTLTAWPRLNPDEIQQYLQPTPLTIADARLQHIAATLAAEYQDREALAEAISNWVHSAMQYQGGVTHVGTSAAEALALGQGLCQDYAHIMLAICRQLGMPARYVSGHMLGEGGSHAWVEVLLPDAQGQYRAVAFDPTNKHRTTSAYITVAVGRDYRDVSPTSGNYIAPYQGHLHVSKRAGLTYLEYQA